MLKSLTTSSSPLRFGLFAFALTIIINLLVHPELRLESLTGPASLYLVLSAWAYFLTLRPVPRVHYQLLIFSILLILYIAYSILHTPPPSLPIRAS